MQTSPHFVRTPTDSRWLAVPRSQPDAKTAPAATPATPGTSTSASPHASAAALPVKPPARTGVPAEAPPVPPRRLRDRDTQAGATPLPTAIALERVRGLLQDLRAAYRDAGRGGPGDAAAGDRVDALTGAVITQAAAVRLDGPPAQALAWFRALAHECLAALDREEAVSLVVGAARRRHAAGAPEPWLHAAYQALGHVLHVSPRQPLGRFLPAHTQALADSALQALEPAGAAQCVAGLARGIGPSRLGSLHVLQLVGGLAAPTERILDRVVLVGEVAGRMYEAIGGQGMDSLRFQALFAACLQPCLVLQAQAGEPPSRLALHVRVLGSTAIQSLLVPIGQATRQAQDPAAARQAWAQVSVMGRVLARLVMLQPHLLSCFVDLVLFEEARTDDEAGAAALLVGCVRQLRDELFPDLARRTRATASEPGQALRLLQGLAARPGISAPQRAALARLAEVARALLHFHEPGSLSREMQAILDAGAKPAAD